MGQSNLTERLLIFGATGQLAQSFKSSLGSKGCFVPRSQVDFLKPKKAKQIINDLKPSAVINAVAYTAVDQAEADPDTAFAINSIAPEMIAAQCKELDIPFVHYSTDYVFSGSKKAPYGEADPTDPINIYGKSKLEGERAVVEVGGLHLIFRTSWVFSEYGNNFVKSMVRLGQIGKPFNVVSDQMGTPTYAKDIAEATLVCLNNFRSEEASQCGIYHMTSEGCTNWYEFAREVFLLSREFGTTLDLQLLNPVTSSEYLSTASRPANSRLDVSKISSVFGVKLPRWRDSLRTCMEQIYENK